MAAKKKPKKKRGFKTPVRGLTRAEARYYYQKYLDERTKKTNPVKMRKPPKGWMKAKAVRVVRRGGRQVVEVKR